MKPKLVTITGLRTNTLRQMLSHYKEYVSDIHLVIYNAIDVDNKIEFNRALEIGKEFGCIIHKKKEKVYNWEAVTRFYNEIKSLYPNDWWIVADDDELQLYKTSIEYIIEDSEENGWEFVTGGFIDKIGRDGDFPEVNESTNLWEAFPISSFFRYPISYADANKVTLMKGKIELTNGQHYARIDGHTTWRWQGWRHPLRYPVYKNFTQVHHFKWDKSVTNRLKNVADINKEYAYSLEYKKMHDYLEKNNYRINLKEFEEWNCNSQKNFIHYYRWKKLTNKILNI